MSNKLINFIQKARQVHGMKYCYALVNYENKNSKVDIICHTHGIFTQPAYSHLRGSNCHKCANKISASKSTLTTEQFIKKAKEINGSKYDYSKCNYIKATEKVEIICLEHGSFWQLPYNHLKGNICPKCNDKKKSEKFTQTTDWFIESCNQIHNFKYDYSLVDYTGNRNYVIIICPFHGKFKQLANGHLKGSGCRKCQYENLPQNQTLTQNQFIEKANKVHFDKYDYSQSIYTKWNGFVEIICPEHGKFIQRAGSHLQGVGCPVCRNSKGETIIRNFLINKQISFEQQYRFQNCKYKLPLPFDFYLKKQNTCIEYDGQYHYLEYSFGSDKSAERKKKNLELVQLKDLIKTQYCKDNNIKLIRIPYWEYDNIESILEKELIN